MERQEGGGQGVGKFQQHDKQRPGRGEKSKDASSHEHVDGGAWDWQMPLLLLPLIPLCLEGIVLKEAP